MEQPQMRERGVFFNEAECQRLSLLQLIIHDLVARHKVLKDLDPNYYNEQDCKLFQGLEKLSNWCDETQMRGRIVDTTSQ
jgi:hypothetical protein